MRRAFVPGGLSFLALLVSATLAAAVTPEAGRRIDPGDFQESLLAAAIFRETNQRRTDLGLPGFLPDERASQAARVHARWMAGTHRLVHDEFSSQGTPVTAFDRLVQQGFRPHLAAENIAYNLVMDIQPGRLFYTREVNGRPVYSYRPGGPAIQAYTYEDFARAILSQWMRSPPHRAHIADPELRFMGIGTAPAHRRKHPDTIYVAQDFFTPHERSSEPVSGATLIPSRPASPR